MNRVRNCMDLLNLFGIYSNQFKLQTIYKVIERKNDFLLMFNDGYLLKYYCVILCTVKVVFKIAPHIHFEFRMK